MNYLFKFLDVVSPYSGGYGGVKTDISDGFIIGFCIFIALLLAIISFIIIKNKHEK